MKKILPSLLLFSLLFSFQAITFASQEDLKNIETLQKLQTLVDDEPILKDKPETINKTDVIEQTIEQAIKSTESQDILQGTQQAEQKLLDLRASITVQQQLLEEKQQLFAEQQFQLEREKEIASKEIEQQQILLEQKNNLITTQQQLLEKQEQQSQQRLKQIKINQQKMADDLLKEKSMLNKQAKILAEKQRLTEKQRQENDQHWLNQGKKFFSQLHSLYLIIAVIVAFLMFILYLVTTAKTAKKKTDFNPELVKEVIKTEIKPSKNTQPEIKKTKIPDSNTVSNKPFIWLAIIAAPLALYFYMLNLGINKEVAIYTGIVVITLIMWMSSLLAEFVPALIALLLVLLFGLAPNDVVLSGFSSPGFLLLFSVMGLGVVITSSGLTRRYTLWLIKSIPSNLFANQFAMFFTGLVFNPIVPTINGRAMIVAPILHNIVSGWDDKTKEKSATPLYTSSIDGINFLSPIFLTAAPANLMIYGLLPPQEQQAFEFIFWIYAASVVGLVMFLLYFIVTALFFRSFTKVKIEKQLVIEELKHLGRLKWREWIALTGIFLMAVGIATSSIHKVPIPLITFGVLCAVLVMGVLTRDQFIKNIDWSFLMLLASMIGILSTMSHLGIDKTLVTQFSWLGDYMRNDFQKFVLVLTGMILLVRIFIPLNSAILIFAAALLPLATGAGVSAWVVGFIILIMCGTAFFGYQSPYILYFQSLLKGEVPYVDLKYQIFQLILVAVKIVAIFASIPFWTKIGVL